MDYEKLTYDFTLCVPIYDGDVETGCLTGPEAYAALSEEAKEELCENFNCSDLFLYFHDGELVSDMEMELLESGIARIHVTQRAELTDSDKDELKQFLDVQMQDGWGEGVEVNFS